MNKRLPLGQLARFVNGLPFKPSDWTGKGRPIIRIQNLNDSSKLFNRTAKEVADDFVIRRGDLMVSWSASLGVFEWKLDEEAVLNQHIFKVTPNLSLVTKDYLRFALEGAVVDMAKKRHGATMTHVVRGDFLGTTIPVPSLDEQRKTATTMNRVDALRKKHDEAQGLVGDLVPAVFQEMFGEKHHFESQLLGDMTVFRTSGSRGWAQYYSDSGAIFLRIQNVKDTKLHLDKVAYVKPPNSAESKRTRVEPGDILISITADLGRIGVIPHNIGEAYINQHLVLVRLKEGFFPEYIAGYLASRAGQASLLKRNKSGVKAGLNFDDIDTLRIPVPPIALQKRYLALRAEGERIVSTIERRGNLVDEFSDSLQGTMFE